MLKSILLCCALLAPSPLRPQEGPPRVARAAELELQAQLAEQNVQLDIARGYCAIPVDVTVRDDLLEYLLVGPAGAAHESAFATPVTPSVLNVALLALGVEPGANADWRRKDPLPSEEELRAGASPFDIDAPKGDGFYVYVGWKRGDEVYFHRAEDLIRNLATGLSMERSRWTYLGSKEIPRNRKSGPDDVVFAADVYQNLINIAFFREGYTLLTGSLPECVDQSIWMLNAWIVPERGSRLTLFLARERLSADADHVRVKLAELTPTEGETRR